MGRIVAIAGLGHPGCNQVLSEPPTTEIWGMNTGYTFMERWDRWFDIHRMGSEAYYTPDHPHIQRLADLDCPVYMCDHVPQIPRSAAYPLADVAALGAPYFTCQIAYMIGFAVLLHESTEPIDELRLWGVYAASETEYAYQRACIEYWIGIAQAKGIKVVTHDQAPLLRAPLYGYDSERKNLDRGFLEARRAETSITLDQAECDMAEARGASQALISAQADPARIQDAQMQQAVAAAKVNTLRGAIQMIEHLMDQLPYYEDEASVEHTPMSVRTYLGR